MSKKNILKLAILDMYDGVANQGMRCIKDIVKMFDQEIEYKVYDVRGKAEVPDLSYDIYISTGGPNSPYDGDGHWDRLYFDWMDSVFAWNKGRNLVPKYVFLICHSFQMACIHFNVAKVTPRRSMSFGVFPIHRTPAGSQDVLLAGLNDPFYAADFRSWQAIEPDYRRLKELGAEILALEKARPNVPLERALMAIRFSPFIFSVQFHPEADPIGMLDHFTVPERRKQVIEEHGIEKYDSMIARMGDPEMMPMTYNTIIPRFLKIACRDLFELYSEVKKPA